MTRLGVAVACLVLGVGCGQKAQPMRPAFDCEPIIKIVQERLEFVESHTNEISHIDSRRLHNYLSLLKRYQETKSFEVDEDGYSPLMYAVRYGTVDEVKKLLAAGVDVNIKNTHNETALLIASVAGTYGRVDSEIFKALLSAGADVHATDRHGHTALYNAAWEGSDDFVKMLLDAGADVNVMGDFGSALVASVSQEHYEIGAMLLAAGADANAIGWHSGRAVLVDAAESGHTELVKMLLAAGAKDEEREGQDEIRALVAQGELMPAENPCTALSIAARQGHLKVVKELLCSGRSDINARDGYGCTALMEAANEGHTEIVRVLLLEGADVNVKELYRGDTALSLAKNPEIIELLRKAGAKE